MKHPTLLYLIGPPGVGKTTVMKHITMRLGTAVQHVEKPFAHRVLFMNDSVAACELGAKRENFSGTDALSMSVINLVEPWLKAQPYKLILGEGDRLANERFFVAAKEAGYRLHVVSLEAKEPVLAARRHERTRRVGAPQDEKWLKGRETKVQRLAEQHATLRINAASPPHQLAALILEEMMR